MLDLWILDWRNVGYVNLDLVLAREPFIIFLELALLNWQAEGEQNEQATFNLENTVLLLGTNTTNLNYTLLLNKT